MNLADRFQGILEERISLMVGVLINDRTLSGVDAEHEAVRFPPMAWAKSIFKQASDQGNKMTLRLAHYCTNKPDSLSSQLLHLADLMGYDMEGVQLNMCWPSAHQLQSVRPHFRRIVLEVGHRAVSDCGDDLDRVVSRIGDYGDLITDILIDPSGGRGRLAAFADMVPLLHAIAKSHPDLGIGVAGGLDDSNVSTLLPMFREFPRLSIDAEGRLRTPDNLSLDLAKTYHYVERALGTWQDARRLKG